MATRKKSTKKVSAAAVADAVKQNAATQTEETPEVPEQPVTENAPETTPDVPAEKKEVKEELPKAPETKEPLTTTEAPAEESKKVVAPTTPQPTPAQRRFNDMSASYLAAARSAIETPNQDTCTRATNAFINLMDTVCNLKDMGIYDEFYRFFLEHRNKYLAHSVVLAGVSNLEARRRVRMSAFYTAFFNLARMKVDHQEVHMDIAAIAALTNQSVANFFARRIHL